MGGVLVDEEHLVPLLHNDVGVQDLTCHAPGNLLGFGLGYLGRADVGIGPYGLGGMGIGLYGGRFGFRPCGLDG